MNYFAHGFRFIGDPQMLAGTAVPDWLNVVDRSARVRRKHATPFLNHNDPTVAAVARGIVQHHDDDSWFHSSELFTNLSLRLTLAFRGLLPEDTGFRPSFLGHIVVELLLDAALSKMFPGALDRFYDAMQSVEPHKVAAAVGLMSPKAPERLAWFIGQFCETRFLFDYSDDQKLLFRLNQVLHRVHLKTLPEETIGVLRLAREIVHVKLLPLMHHLSFSYNELYV